MRASPSLSQLWQPHSRLCQLCRVCEQQRSCSPGFCRKELHATESAVEVRRARRRLEDTVTDERVGLFTPDKDGDTADGAGCVPVIAARRGTVCGEVGRVPGFCSTHGPHPLQVRRLNDFRPAAGRAGRGCFGRRSGSDTSFVGASAPKKILGDFLVLPSLPAHPICQIGFESRTSIYSLRFPQARRRARWTAAVTHLLRARCSSGMARSGRDDAHR